MKRFATVTGLLAGFSLFAVTLVRGTEPGGPPLRIGKSGVLNSDANGREKGGMQTFEEFIKDETGLPANIEVRKDWRDVVAGMEHGDLQMGVFQGFEFAWAQEQQPKLKPLAVGINAQRYRVVCIVTSQNNPATNFAGLKGQTLSIPEQGQSVFRLVVDHEVAAQKSTPENFFKKLTINQGIEDALDDVVDGNVQAAVTDRPALDTYKRRKSGRFSQLKVVFESQPLPPPVIAYYDERPDSNTRQRFVRGVLEANRKESGRNVLTLLRLTAFEPVPPDFDKVLAATRKTYPAPGK
ncbi:MAG: phosphate/phosphite/phosphonate ABC transporter substrate-binding protein [Gemmataceae bacterium]